jgi:hypothetical protein
MFENLKRLWSSRIFRIWVLIFLIFLLAFILRIIYPVSRPLVWSDRAFHFIDAVSEQNWAGTYKRYHPGVSIMWLVGIPLRLFSNANGGLTADQFLGVAPTRPGTLVDALQASVILVAFVISLCIALTYPLLRKLANHRIAISGALLLALDPFYIGYSKVIHPDALLATFMLMSALFLLTYLKERRLLMLLLSGLFAGFSFLSKSPSLFLIPYTSLAVTAGLLVPWYRTRSNDLAVHWTKNLWSIARTLLIWAGMVAVAYIIFWPAMWVSPLETIQNVIGGVTKHQANPHGNPIFFNNQIMTTDPGIGYYLSVIGWKTTSVTFPFALLATIFAAIRFRSPESWPVWALLAYVIFFTVQMTLGQFKQIAYLLPIFPALDVIAAFGLVWSAEALARLKPLRAFTRLDRLIIVFLIGVQAIITFTSYPYFTAHYNRLLGGTRVAQNVLPQQDHGEGLEVAARFLNALPHGQHEIAQIHPRSASVFQREFEGRTLTEISPLARYRIYSINHLMRQLGDAEWIEQWEEDQKTEPLLTVEVGGIPQVWVYGQPPADPAAGGPSFNLDYRLGEHIKLEKVRLKSDTISPGDTLTVLVYWRADSEINGDFTVFTHLLSAENELVAQQDNVPLIGIRPTTTWRKGELLEDPYLISTDSSLPTGTYLLSVGMYDTETLERLPVYDAFGELVPDARAVVGVVEVVEETASGG